MVWVIRILFSAMLRLEIASLDDFEIRAGIFLVEFLELLQHTVANSFLAVHVHTSDCLFRE